MSDKPWTKETAQQELIRRELIKRDEKKPMKPWKCKNGHILGYIRWNGNDLPQLMVLRESMDMDAERPDEADVLGPLDGQMGVRCKICDEVTTWKISVDSLLAIFAQLDDATVFEFSKRLLENSKKE